MGAELIITRIRLPRHADGSTVVEWDDFVAHVVDERVLDIDPATMVEILDLCGIGVDEDELDDDAIAQVRALVAEAAKIVISQGDQLTFGERDAIALSFDDPSRIWVIAGGTSWGDSPGDTYDAITLVNYAEVLEEDFPPRT